MAIIVLGLVVGSGTLDAIQVRNIGIQRWRKLNALFLKLTPINFIHSTETEKVLTSPSIPSITSTSSVISPPSHLYYSHSWIPHNIEISLDESGELTVQKANDLKTESNNDIPAQAGNTVENVDQDDNKVQIISENFGSDGDAGAVNCNSIVSNARHDEAKSTNPEISVNIQKIQYGLSAVICYVDDKNNEERKNIVALLRVGPNYHERSAGSAVSQWYIFNDFW